MANQGFVPSYILNNDIGSRITRLKGLDIGWLFPTYIYHYLDNPAPLLLFDEILIDENALQAALDAQKRVIGRYENANIRTLRITKRKAEVLDQLTQEHLFRKIDVQSTLDEQDYQHIQTHYELDKCQPDFSEAVRYLTDKYGHDYAAPNPLSFEAMNINLTQVLLEKFNAKPIDDTYRFPLYAYKYSNGMYGSEIASEIARPNLEPLLVPNESILDVDEFMTLYRDKRMSDFRAKVNEYERQKISRTDLRRKLAQERKKLEKLELNSWEVLIYGISGGFGFGACLATGTVAPLIGLLPTLNVLRKAITKRGYKWLEFAEGITGVLH